MPAGHLNRAGGLTVGDPRLTVRCVCVGGGCDVPSRITGAQVRTHRLPGSRQHSPPPLPIAELWTLPPEIARERARAWGKCAERRTQARTPPPPHFQTRLELLLVGPWSYALQIASLSRPVGSGHL